MFGSKPADERNWWGISGYKMSSNAGKEGPTPEKYFLHTLASPSASVLHLLIKLLAACLPVSDTSRLEAEERVVHIATLLLMLRPHLLAAHLLVVHGPCAVRSMHAMLLIIDLRSVVCGGRVLVGVIALLLPVHTAVG